MIEFVYFDIGGVLLDWSDAFKGAAGKFNLSVRELGRVFDENDDQITKGEMSVKELWEKCVRRYGLKDALGFDFLESWVSDYKPIKETHKLIGEVISKYKIGLLSNIYKGMKPLLINKGIIPDVEYDQVVLSCEVGMRKPELEIYRLAQERCGVEPDKILLVDDRGDFCNGAQKAGWRSFWFNARRPEEAVKELEEFLNNLGF